VEEKTVGYSLSHNYLSDLGRTVSWSGDPNTTASWLFNTAVVVLGLSIIPYFLFLPTHAPDQAEILRVAAAFGVGSSLALIGIGLTPYDVHLQDHQAALFLWIVSLLITVILHFWATLTSRECSSIFALLSLGMAAVIAQYMFREMDLLMASLAGSASAAFGRSIVMQKYVVLSALAWYLVFGLRMVCTTELRPPKRPVALTPTAERLLKQLQQSSAKAVTQRKRPR
jgi:hypothetical membrane protein